ncbi:hypothetical protein B0H11DRAFT_2284053 [Mycena galericulata]|nr:hypothetical protein B0H11DRAFT_2284053 [Mycena galericulata]
MEPVRKRGRPKGSKDGPRPPGAPRRGRPPKNSAAETCATGAAPSQSHDLRADSDADDEFGFDDDGDIDADQWDALDQSVQEIYSSIRVPTPEPPRNDVTLDQLRTAARDSQKRPFFTQSTGFDKCNDSETELESQDEADENPEKSEESSSWFHQPKYMPDWLYRYFHRVIRPMIMQKEKGCLVRPAIFAGALPSFWIHPPEPVFTLSRYSFDPSVLYRPRIFLWLPHFFVEKLFCPNCGKELEKNGALTPRRIVDIDSNFYIVAWAYYCRGGRANDGCKKHFHGWSKQLLESLPPYLQLAFPAILSRKSGVSRNVMNQLRVGNQHKMGPNGVRSLLLESHTLRFAILQNQYLEAVFEMVRGRQIDLTGQLQSNLDSFLAEKISGFGDFGDANGYAGFVPSERYLSSILNKAIELDEADANQHTACQRADQLALDDNHKINKHIATVDGQPIFGALWTCMDSRGIRAQALTLTKSHEERIGPLRGIAKSLKLYGFDDPQVVFTDDPLKDKRLIYDAFPSLARNLALPVSPRGLESFAIPDTVQIHVVSDTDLADKIFSSFTEALDADKDAHMCISVDAEWNESRKIGVSILQIAPHSEDTVFIIPVHRFKSLPAALLRLLISDRVFKIGSRIKGDLTRLQNQFSQLKNVVSFNVIDLKEYSIQRGVIGRKDSGGLDVLVEKILGKYLAKDPSIRRCEEWEARDLHPDLRRYAALDVLASRRVFEEVTKIAPLVRVQHDTAAGTRVALVVQEGGQVAAFGIRVAVPSKTRVMVDIDHVLLPSVAAVLHLLPSALNSTSRRTKSGAYTLGELKESTTDSTFCVVSPISLLQFDRRRPSERQYPTENSEMPSSTSDGAHSRDAEFLDDPGHGTLNDSEPETEGEGSISLQGNEELNENMHISMLEAHAAVSIGKRKEQDSQTDTLSDADTDIVQTLRKIIDSESPSSPEPKLTRLKKDLFHAFHMLALNDHGLRAQFCADLRDHLMRWDPVSRKSVDEVCRKYFGITFEVMLARNPDYIKRRTPRYVPPPRIIVQAIEHIFKGLGYFAASAAYAPRHCRVSRGHRRVLHTTAASFHATAASFHTSAASRLRTTASSNFDAARTAAVQITSNKHV